MARKYSCSLRVQVRGASADAPSCSQAFGFPEGMWCLEVAPRGAPGSRGWLSVSLRCLGVRHPAARLPAAVTFRLKHTVAERRDVVKTVAASFSSGEPAVSVAQLKSLDALEGYVKDGHVVVEAELAGADDPEAELAKMVQLPPNEGARQMERMLRSGALSDVTLVARARQQRRHSSSDEPDRPPPPTTRTTKTSEVAERPAEGGGSASQQQQQQQRGGGGAAALLPSDGVEVDVNVRRIPCHRVVLASHSQPLLRMLDPSGPMREASQAEVVLHDTDPQALHAMVQWMYGSPAELPLAKLPTLWQLADLYDVPALRDAVQAEVQRQLSRQPSVAAAVFSLAKGLTPDGPLVELAWGVLCAEEHLQAAATFVDLRWLLDGPDMARLLKAATRVGDKHTCWTVLSCMLDWAAAALEERQALVPGLLAAIDLSRDMSTDRLKAVRRHPACSGGTDDAARMAISAALLDVYERRADRGHGSAPRSATRRRRNRGNRGGGGGAAGSSGGAAAGAQQRSGGGGQQAAGAAAAALTQQGALALLNDPVLLEHVVAELVTAQFQRRRDL